MLEKGEQVSVRGLVRWMGGQEGVTDEATVGQRSGGKEEVAKETERAEEGKVWRREGARW